MRRRMICTLITTLLVISGLLLACYGDIKVDEIVEVGELDPESVVTPGIYVDRIIKGEKYDVGFK